MIDQFGPRAPGREITLRINPGFGHGHSQKTNTGGEQSKHGIWHDATRRVPAIAPTTIGLTVTGLHMHIGSGTDLEHLAQVCGAMEQAAAEVGPSLTLDQRRRRAADALSRRATRYVDLDAYFALWDATRKRLEDAFRPRRAAGDRAGPLPGGRERLSGGARSAPSSGRATTRSTCSTPASTISPGRSSTAPIIRCRSCPADRRGPSGRWHEWSSAGRCASRATSSRRRKAASSRPLAAGGRGRRIPGDRVRRGLRVRDGLELQQQAAGGRSADRRRPAPPDPPPADVRRPDRRRIDSRVRGPAAVATRQPSGETALWLSDRLSKVPVRGTVPSGWPAV